ncbi:MAG: hypothetical protein LDLANPLL_00087 [Turneriella sp.]|nr:hypothetical protein [Turneriella sp.]
MGKTATMNIRIDQTTRQELKTFAGQIGIPASALIHASIKQMLRSRQVSFQAEIQPSPYLEKIIEQAEADYKKRKNTTRVENREQMKAFLDSL